MRLQKEIFDPKEFFRRTVENQKTAGFYLFAGEDDFKKIETARFLAKALNCRQALNNEDCFCDNCLKIEVFKHPDVLWLKPALGQKIKIESVRETVRKVYLKPYMSAQKIFIVENADLLTEEAQNAFLKTLEEPPKNSVIVLMARQKELLLDTIVSRAQVIQFLSPQSAVDTDIFVKDFLLNENRMELLNGFAKKLEKQDWEKFLSGLLNWFRDALMCKVYKEEFCINKEDLANIKEIARKHSFIKIEQIMGHIIYLKSLIQRNINSKIALSILCFSLEE